MSRIKRMKSNCFITGDPDLITGPRDVVLSRQHDRYRKQHTHQHVCLLISSRPAACDEKAGACPRPSTWQVRTAANNLKVTAVSSISRAEADGGVFELFPAERHREPQHDGQTEARTAYRWAGEAQTCYGLARCGRGGPVLIKINVTPCELGGEGESQVQGSPGQRSERWPVSSY